MIFILRGRSQRLQGRLSDLRIIIPDPDHLRRTRAPLHFFLFFFFFSSKGAFFRGEYKSGFVISDHMDSSSPITEKTEDPKKGSFTMTTACPRAPLDEKNRGKKQQTDPRDEDKKDQEREAT